MDNINITIKLIEELFTWRSILDILVITTLIFLLYRTFLRLGTVKIALGIFFAIAIFIVASLLDLTGIKWLYSNISHVAVIAIIIIFQPELRKIFERSVSLKRSEIIGTGADLSKIMADALFALAEQKRGALIVFPGKEPVEEWLSGGQVLNAEPSHPLIMSIFDPNSPGHDGAMVIKNGRLTHFGVRLPISQSNRLPAEFGTRHYAAMGLSELSDALVFVVSEERGKISILYEGKIKQVSKKETVIQSILDHWGRTTSYPFELLKRKPGWRVGLEMVVSLAMAVFFILTLYIAKGQVIEKVLSVPVEFSATPHDIVLVGEKISEVKLHLAGSKQDLDSLTPGQITVKIDLSKAMPGKQEVVITEDNINLPRNVQLLDVVPSSLKLALASIIEQEIPIKPQLVGNLPKGLTLKSVKVIPDKVRVLSPLSEGKKAKINLTTTPIYLESVQKTTTLYCKIIAPANIQPYDKPWQDVEVTLEISP